LAVLFVPVTYRIDAGKQERAEVKATVGWLFHLLTVRYQLQMEDSKPEQKLLLRILGIPILDFLNPGKKKGKPKRKRKSGKTHSTDASTKAVPPEKVSEKSEEMQTTHSEPNQKNPNQKHSESDEMSKKCSEAAAGHGLAYAIRNFYDKLKNIWMTLKKIWKKKSDFLEFWNQEEHRRARSSILKELRYLWKKSRPRRLEGEFHFGFEDPSATGMCMGALSMLYAWYPQKLLLKPDFEQKVLEGNILIKGRIQICTLVLIFRNIWFNKDIRRMYERWQQI
jgi:hypothetical protein